MPSYRDGHADFPEFAVILRVTIFLIFCLAEKMIQIFY